MSTESHETKTCPKCAENIRASANKCKHCHADLRNWFVRHKIISAFISLFILTSILGAFADLLESDNSTYTSTTSQTLSVGDEGILSNNGDPDCSGVVILGRTEEALSEAMDAGIADDDFGKVELLLSDQIFLVPNCTAIKVIDTKFLVSEVRILEGDYIGQSGWLPYEFVSP